MRFMRNSKGKVMPICKECEWKVQGPMQDITADISDEYAVQQVMLT